MPLQWLAKAMTLKVACITTAPKEKLKLFSPKFMHYGNLIQLSICKYKRTRESWETHGESKLGNLDMNHVLTSILPEKNILLSPITPPPPPSINTTVGQCWKGIFIKEKRNLQNALRSFPK